MSVDTYVDGGHMHVGVGWEFRAGGINLGTRHREVEFKAVGWDEITCGGN